MAHGRGLATTRLLSIDPARRKCSEVIAGIEIHAHLRLEKIDLLKWWWYGKDWCLQAYDQDCWGKNLLGNLVFGLYRDQLFIHQPYCETVAYCLARCLIRQRWFEVGLGCWRGGWVRYMKGWLHWPGCCGPGGLLWGLLWSVILSCIGHSYLPQMFPPLWLPLVAVEEQVSRRLHLV